MNGIMKAVLVLLLGLSTAVPVHAQGIEWSTLNDEVMSLYRQGRYDRAVVVAKKALQIAEQTVGPNHPSMATSLNNLATLYYSQGQYAQAEPLYKRSLAIDEKALGPNHPNVATDLNNLAALYKTQGQCAPTQIISELFKREGLDGVAYKSNLGKGFNLVLFNLEAADIINCSLFRVKSVEYTFDEAANPYFVSKYYEQKAKSPK